MTKDELNRLIAERLFGFKVYNDWTEVPEWHPNGMKDCFPMYQLTETTLHTLPDYAGTWEGAGKVIEEMRKRGWIWYAGEDEQGTFFRFVKRGAGENGADLMASCEGNDHAGNCALAALAALEEKGKSNGTP